MLLPECLLYDRDTLVVLELIPCIRDNQDLEPLPQELLLVMDTNHVVR